MLDFIQIQYDPCCFRHLAQSNRKREQSTEVNLTYQGSFWSVCQYVWLPLRSIIWWQQVLNPFCNFFDIGHERIDIAFICKVKQYNQFFSPVLMIVFFIWYYDYSLIVLVIWQLHQPNLKIQREQPKRMSDSSTDMAMAGNASALNTIWEKVYPLAKYTIAGPLHVSAQSACVPCCCWCGHWTLDQTVAGPKKGSCGVVLWGHKSAPKTSTMQQHLCLISIRFTGPKGRSLTQATTFHTLICSKCAPCHLEAFQSDLSTRTLVQEGISNHHSPNKLVSWGVSSYILEEFPCLCSFTCSSQQWYPLLSSCLLSFVPDLEAPWAVCSRLIGFLVLSCGGCSSRGADLAASSYVGTSKIRPKKAALWKILPNAGGGRIEVLDCIRIWWSALQQQPWAVELKCAWIQTWTCFEVWSGAGHSRGTASGTATSLYKLT